jgi:hypothetical protein
LVEKEVFWMTVDVVAVVEHEKVIPVLVMMMIPSGHYENEN